MSICTAKDLSKARSNCDVHSVWLHPSFIAALLISWESLFKAVPPEVLPRAESSWGGSVCHAGLPLSAAQLVFHGNLQETTETLFESLR